MSPLMKKIGTWGGISWEFLEVRSSEIICIRVNVCHQRDNFLLRLHVRRALWWRNHWICRVKKKEERVIGRSSSWEHRQILKRLIESWEWLNWYPSSPHYSGTYAKVIFEALVQWPHIDFCHPHLHHTATVVRCLRAVAPYHSNVYYNNPSSCLLVLLAKHLLYS